MFFFFIMLFMLINMLLNILLRVKEFFKTKQPEIQRNIEELSGKSWEDGELNDVFFAYPHKKNNILLNITTWR